MAELDAYKVLGENKIDKCNRNNEALEKTFNRALKGDFDVTKMDVTGEDLLKVKQIFHIRREFVLETSTFIYHSYKEVFYIQDPHKYNFDDVCEPIVIRRISSQSERYAFYDQVKNTVERYHCDIIDGDTGKKLTLKDVEKDLPKMNANQA